MASHRQGSLAWYDAPISAGPLKAANNKIQFIERQSFGFGHWAIQDLQLHTDVSKNDINPTLAVSGDQIRSPATDPINVASRQSRSTDRELARPGQQCPQNPRHAGL
ncbi:MAG: transposase [Planctomycetes bacterium]|nr:transposase [Planctomycetota bacterium]